MTLCARAGALFLAGSIAAARMGAQAQPATIPVAVAEAMMFEAEPFGRPQFFDGKTPTGWPPTLIPPDAKILGGGTMGVGREFRMMTSVFSFPARSNAREVLRAMITKEGYTPFDGAIMPGSEGGFVETPRTGRTVRYCKNQSSISFDSMERTQGPNVFVVMMLDGEAARQNCSPQQARLMGRELPVTLPSLTPPKGTTFMPGGSSWGGDGGSISASLRTTLQTDSILYHYRDQLVAGGWRAEGRPAVGDGAAVQRFSFREKNEPWAAALVILVVGDRRELEIRYSRAP